jgi:hypothetical protein
MSCLNEVDTKQDDNSHYSNESLSPWRTQSCESFYSELDSSLFPFSCKLSVVSSKSWLIFFFFWKCLVASYKNIVSVHIDQATADSKAPLFTFPLSLLREWALHNHNHNHKHNHNHISIIIFGLSWKVPLFQAKDLFNCMTVWFERVPVIVFFLVNNGSLLHSWSWCQWRRNFHSGQGKNTTLCFT